MVGTFFADTEKSLPEKLEGVNGTGLLFPNTTDALISQSLIHILAMYQ
jgi:hypothetical protein